MSNNLYLVLAVSMNTIVHGGQEMLDDIKIQLENGWITDLVILCSNDKNSTKNISQFMDKRGHPWAKKKVIPRLDDEEIDDYIARIFIDYDVTHFVEPTRSILAKVAHESYLSDVKLYQIKKGAWGTVRAWMIRTSPHFNTLIDKASDAFEIINTGYAAKATRDIRVRV